MKKKIFISILSIGMLTLIVWFYNLNHQMIVPEVIILDDWGPYLNSQNKPVYITDPEDILVVAKVIDKLSNTPTSGGMIRGWGTEGTVNIKFQDYSMDYLFLYAQKNGKYQVYNGRGTNSGGPYYMELTEQERLSEILEKYLRGSQDEMTDMEADYEERLEILGSENDRLKKEISDIQKKYNKEIIDIKSSIIVDKDDLFQVDNHTFRIDIIGKEILEDGVIVILEGYDGLKLQWVKTWEGIQVAELTLISGLTLWEDKVYVVVDGNLNVIDLFSGETMMTVEYVGKADAAPLIAEDGTIYTIGQYVPFVTSIDKSGLVNWRIEDSTLNHAYEMTLDNGDLYVKTLSGEFLVYLDGTYDYLDSSGNIINPKYGDNIIADEDLPFQEFIRFFLDHKNDRAYDEQISDRFYDYYNTMTFTSFVKASSLYGQMIENNIISYLIYGVLSAENHLDRLEDDLNTLKSEKAYSYFTERLMQDIEHTEGNSLMLDDDRMGNYDDQEIEKAINEAGTIDELVEVSFIYPIDGAYAEAYSIQVTEIYGDIGLKKLTDECCSYGEVIQEDFISHLAYGIGYFQDRKEALLEEIDSIEKNEVNEFFLRNLKYYLEMYE